MKIGFSRPPKAVVTSHGAPWNRVAGALGALGLVAAAAAASCADDLDGAAQDPPDPPASDARLSAIRAAHPVLAASDGAALRLAGSHLERSCAGACATEVRLPLSADAPATIAEPRTSVAAHFAIAGALPSAPHVEGALAFYPAAVPGGDLVHRVGTHGTEDFFHFAQRPPRESIRYEVVFENVRALRLVAGILELLDRKGVPRLRLARPWVEGADGRRLAASISVEGCPVDRDPRAPWTREIEALPDAHCEVVVDWSASGATYPLLVDPEWQDSNNMINARTHHSATFLPGRGVLLAGGFDVDGAPVAEAEIMCPVELCGANEFSPTDAMGQARGAHTATLLDDGNVLVAGGRNLREAGTTLAGTAIYATEDGEFSAGPTMTRPRDGHTATALGRGRVLVAGGDGLSPSTAEIYDETAGDFAATANMSVRRTAHTAAALSTPGVVLLAGGIGNGGFALQSAEIFDDEGGTFTPVVGNMTATRAFATSTLLEDGRILVTGGTNGSGVFYKTADIFDPADGGGRFQQQPVVMEAPRAFHTATKLLGEPGVPGKVLLTGGFDGGGLLAASEVFDAEAVEFSLSSTMIKSRAFHTATLLPSGQVVVTGGGYDLATVDQATATSTETLQRENGEPCAEGSECGSGFCPGAPDGICCDAPCEGTCEICSTGECLVVPDDTTVKPVCSDAVQFLLVCVDGEVSAGEVQTCDAFGCNGDECAESCTDDSLCSDVGYCSGTTCLPKKEIGGSCAEDRECLGGFCADGVCCNARCGEQCQACDVPGSLGVCQQNEGPPRPGHEPCEGDGGPCEGVCGSKPDECDYPDATCTEGSCADGTLSIGRCHVEEIGVCTAVTEACEPFACNDAGNACNATCTSSADCAPGLACNDGGSCVIVESVQCDGDHIVLSPDGSAKDCSPFKCREGACLGRCGSIDDCTAPSVCDAEGDCIDPPDDPAAPDGCAVSDAHGRTGDVAWLVIVTALALSRRRGPSEVAR